MADSQQQQSFTSKPFSPAYIADPRLMVDKILNNELLGGLLTLPVYLQESNGTIKKQNTIIPEIVTVPFFLEGNFSFSLGNTWQPMVDASMFQAIGDMMNMGNYALNDQMNGEAQVSMVSTQMQVASWKGSEQPKFRISTVFTCVRRDYNPVNIIKALSETCLPRRLDSAKNSKTVKARDGVADVPLNVANWLGDQVGGDTGDKIKKYGKGVSDSIRNTGLAAPLYFAPNYNSDANKVEASNTCTLTLEVGRWFRAPQLIVTSISNIEFSKEVVAPPTDWTYNYDDPTSIYKGIRSGLKTELEYGFPLYAKCTIELQPITYITADEFLNYFMKPPTKPNLPKPNADSKKKK